MHCLVNKYLVQNKLTPHNTLRIVRFLIIHTLAILSISNIIMYVPNRKKTTVIQFNQLTSNQSGASGIKGCIHRC